MNQEKILDALNGIDDDMVEAVEALREGRRQSKVSWLRWGAMAACICVVFAGAVMWRGRFTSNTGSSTPMEGLEAVEDGTAAGGAAADGTPTGVTGESVSGGVVIPPMQVDLQARGDVAMDMMAFFIYQGRSYVQYEYIYDNTDLVGEYLGTATGLINEWTPADGYVELAGSVSGDFYAVKGFDPSFILCMQYDDGSTQTFINNNGLTLHKGAELYEDRLRLTGNYTAVDFQTQYNWDHSTGVIHTVPEENAEAAEQFVAALNNGEIMLVEDIPFGEDESGIVDGEIYHLFFRMDNGMTVHLRLHEDGYVRFQGLRSVCVQIDAQTFGALLDILSTAMS